MAVTPFVALDASAAPAKTAPARVPDEVAVAAADALAALDAVADESDDTGEAIGGADGSGTDGPGADAPGDGTAPEQTPVVEVSGPTPAGDLVPATESAVGGEDAAAAEPEPEPDPVADAMRALADLVAERGGVKADELVEVWSSTSDQRYRVILAALAQVGDGYRYASAGPDLFDCSGLSKYAWGSVGVSLFHNSKRQIDAAIPKDKKDLLPGDLVWRPGHVMVYLGVGDLIVNAVQPGVPVSVKKWGKVYRFGSPIRDEVPEPVDAPEA